MASKRSKHELKRLAEKAVSDVCGFPRSGLWLCVDELETHGWPPEQVTVWATLHFTSQGSPFCCGEPCCHLWLFGERLREAGESLRRELGLVQPVSLDFRYIGAVYHAGVTFKRQGSETTG